MAQIRNTYVEKTLMPDVQQDARQKYRTETSGLLSIIHLGEVVALRRVARLIVDGQVAVSEDWGAFDHPAPRRHQELNQRMDRRAASLAEDWGDGETPLPIRSLWRSRSELMANNTPIGFGEPEVPARHAPLFAYAAFLLRNHPDISVTDGCAIKFDIAVDTDTMPQRPLDKYDLLGIGVGQGTAAEPDWLIFEELVTHSIDAFDAAYEWGEPVPAFKLAFEGMRRACLVQ